MLSLDSLLLKGDLHREPVLSNNGGDILVKLIGEEDIRPKSLKKTRHVHYTRRLFFGRFSTHP